MTRILYWNIQKFSVNKFWEETLKRDIHGSPILSQKSRDRWNYFRYAFDNYGGMPARTPEIIVIVELQTGPVARGTLVSARGPEATQNLVAEVRNWTGNANWMTVPPLCTKSYSKEGVIVLYDSTNLIFTGPDIWPGGDGPAQQAPFGPHPAPAPFAPASPYPAEWDPYIRTGALNRPIPHGSLYNANLWENQMAAKVANFTSSGGAGLDPAPGGIPAAGTVMDGNLGPRTPYMTTFFRPATNENITLFAVHSPASGNARNYMYALACTAEIANQPVNAFNERKVVVGDFNYNLFEKTDDHAEYPTTMRNGYGYFMQRGYSIGIHQPGYLPPPSPAPPPPPNPPLGYYDYFGTQLMPEDNGLNWSIKGFPLYYPGYGYMRNMNVKCIDNIFATGPNFQNITVLNPVVGSPYNVLPVGGAPAWLTPGMRGHFLINSLCPCYNPPNPPQWQAPPFAAGMHQVFRDWQNFGRIRSTSDHLPIMAEF